MKALAVSLFIWLALVLASPRAHGQNVTAFESVKSFLDQRDNAASVLLFVHFGATLRSHQFLRATDVTDSNGHIIPGESAIIYRYFWEEDGITDVAFFYNGRGVIGGTSIDWTNAQISRPFAFANLSVWAVGHFVIDSDSKMSEQDRKFARDLIDRSDAHGLMNLWLRMR